MGQGVWRRLISRRCVLVAVHQMILALGCATAACCRTPGEKHLPRAPPAVMRHLHWSMRVRGTASAEAVLGSTNDGCLRLTDVSLRGGEAGTVADSAVRLGSFLKGWTRDRLGGSSDDGDSSDEEDAVDSGDGTREERRGAVFIRLLSSAWYGTICS